MIDIQRYPVRDQHVCGGEPVIKGTRVTERTVLASLAEGARTEEMLADFPTLSEEAIRGVIAFPAAPPRRIFRFRRSRAFVRIKLDENLPARLAGYLASLDHDTDTVPDEGLTGDDDNRVWDAAQQEERFVVVIEYKIRNRRPGP